MKTIVRMTLALATTLGAACGPVAAQFVYPVYPGPDVPAKFDVALNASYKIAKITSTTNRFFIPGGSVDAAYNFRGFLHGFSLAVDFNGESASNIEPGVSLSQLSLVAGPRYTVRLRRSSGHPIALYGQALGGFDRAFNSLFPGATSVSGSASSAALQAGGGASIRIKRAWSVRLFEADFIMTSLPNTANNQQYDLRISSGVVLHF